MKKKLTKTAWEALDEALQALYKKAEGSDNYLLDLEDDDDTGAELKKAKDREKKRADKAEKDLSALREEFETFKEEQAEKGDGSLDKAAVDALKAKHVKELAAKDVIIAEHSSELTRVLITEAAERTATDISTMPDLLSEKMAKRLKVEWEDGKAVVKVLDEDGNVTDKKIEDLTAEFVANEKYAPIIVASKASGSGAAGGGPKGGARKKLSEMSATEESEFANRDPDGYKRQAAAEGVTLE